MIRVEIIANQSVEDDIKENLEENIPNFQYTVLPAMQGRGLNSAKLGDSTWPELNFVLFAYVDEDTARKIKSIINAVVEKFPREGISLFFCQCVEL